MIGIDAICHLDDVQMIWHLCRGGIVSRKSTAGPPFGRCPASSGTHGARGTPNLAESFLPGASFSAPNASARNDCSVLADGKASAAPRPLFLTNADSYPRL